jgi:hypothetical protein
MSYTTITQAARDQALQDRIVAAAQKEVISNPEFGDSWFGEQVKQGSAPIGQRLGYPVAVSTEAAYESAVIAGNENPGGDPAVITDSAILSAVQANWPEPPDVIVP